MRNRETEVKIRIAHLPATRKRLRELGFRPVHRRSLEDNSLLDTPERILRASRSILRLRRYGTGWWLTYKGTPAPDQFYKSRLEIETEIKNPDAIRSILKQLGFRAVFRYQKFRTQYSQISKNSPELSLDETPIGNFIELEGSRKSIDRVARLLGYSRADYITASYGALYLEECRKSQITPSDMVFPKRSTRRKKAQN